MYSAFRFFHPAHDAAQGAPGLRLDSAGRLETTSDRMAVRQALLLLLSTQPGERVMRPEYGCSLQHLVFAPNDETTAGLAIHYVQRALRRWEPRIELLSVSADPDPNDPAVLLIVVNYAVRATLERDTLSYRVALDGRS